MNHYLAKYPFIHFYLSQSNTESCQYTISKIIDYWEMKYPKAENKGLMKILEMAHRGSERNWLPIEDPNKGYGEDYGLMIKKSGEPYSSPLKLYYPRGLCPVVWYENYEKLGRIMNLNLIQFPELLLEIPISIRALIDGYMMSDIYVGK